MRDTGYVGIAKQYRSVAREKGLLVTLEEKAKKTPAVRKLFGAVDLWFWDDVLKWRYEGKNSRSFAEILGKLGMTDILWSGGDSRQNVEYFNSLGFLSGKGDIYQDVYDPAWNLPPWENTKGWPEDLVLLPSQERMKGWVTYYNGKDYPGGVICSTRSIEWMKRLIPPDLASHPYAARFIDTTTANPLRECYNQNHPLSRSDDRRGKTAMLDYVSGGLGLVTGSETGMDWAVPSLHYFEGMMSLGPYRFNDSGYSLLGDDAPSAEYLRYQVGTSYRIPLFELVYHDCVVSYWYWGDSSNRVPDVWRDKDLFNVLYGTPPLWVVDPGVWSTHKDRFIASYKDGRATAVRTAGKEMTSHSFLTADKTVQRSSFADGTEAWVNFGTRPYTLDSGKTLPAKGYLVLP